MDYAPGCSLATCPAPCAWKASGLGKDLGHEAFAANRRTKSVLIDI
jgi:acyl-CoA reductase-like NAD-dependent aldehyde dehydrogenase